MAPVYLVIISRTTAFNRPDYKVVECIPSGQPLTHTEDPTNYFYHTTRIYNSQTRQWFRLKLQIAKQDHVISLEVANRHETQKLAETAMVRRLDLDYAERLRNRQSFELAWRFQQGEEIPEQWRDEGRKVSAELLASDHGTVWYDVYEFKVSWNAQ
ncbi:hypothetical protein DDE83_005822 [Stemphylium lycopersici]|uniref:Uncharacterized protein n=1 Tax=Stemphylium lycopersici TaxID=183478 RepID=A0A364N0Q8_STELY|nr:hypothetical protein DDE83_005822 [Stemphylium lycopersici]